MREPEQILEQVSSWRPESLVAYERRRRAQRTTEHDRLMAEAERMWAAELEREKEAAKGGRPPKDGKTLKGTGVLRFRKGGSTRPRGGHGTQGEYKRGCRCADCTRANREAAARNRESRRAGQAGERAA